MNGRGRSLRFPPGTVADAGKVNLDNWRDRPEVVVSKETRKVREWVHNKKGKRTGARRLVEKEVVKYASAHDLRRSFGSRWSRKVYAGGTEAAHAPREHCDPPNSTTST